MTGEKTPTRGLFERLLERSGFDLVELLRTDGASSIVVAAPR